MLLDIPAGIERCALAALSAAEQTLIVTMPNSPSVADALKAKIAAQRLMSKPFAFMMNMVREEKGELKRDEISAILELPCYGVIPYDPDIRRTFLENTLPIVVRKSNSAAAKAIIEIANKLSGKEVNVHTKKGPSIFSKLFSVFKKKGGKHGKTI